ncbi:hypothetical protein NDU88_010527 [Pleurodeles waltl]|uniref:Uncharacterized protein n=1 Tax=Pleurodeles waltl TaxID=8319 RepID=A0AAV7S0X1_PLEWA|nr:hypothetical protein NDU88_010527 [Pleurodeles waltl]
MFLIRCFVGRINYEDDQDIEEGEIWEDWGESNVKEEPQKNLIAVLRALLGKLGISSNVYGMLSFHVGVATDAKREGKSDKLIMDLGRWRATLFLERDRVSGCSASLPAAVPLVVLVSLLVRVLLPVWVLPLQLLVSPRVQVLPPQVLVSLRVRFLPLQLRVPQSQLRVLPSVGLVPLYP